MKSLKNETKAVLSLIAVSLVFVSGFTYALMARQDDFGGQGKIRALGVVVLDSDASTELVTLDWGWLNEPSSAGEYTHLVYVNNTGNFNVTLTKIENSWTPSEAETYISQTWNYTGAVLPVGEMMPIELTLTVLDIPDDGYGGILFDTFSYVCTVTGTSVS